MEGVLMKILEVVEENWEAFLKRISFQDRAILRFLIFSRDGFTCVYCGRSRFEDHVRLNVDHIRPKSQGGVDSFSNIVTACAECNCGKSDSFLSDDIARKVMETIRQHTEDFRQRYSDYEETLRDDYGYRRKKMVILLWDGVEYVIEDWSPPGLFTLRNKDSGEKIEVVSPVGCFRELSKEHIVPENDYDKIIALLRNAGMMQESS